MPHVLAKTIDKDAPGLWGEGAAYDCCSIYSIDDGAPKPPVNYSAHTIKPHSVCHADAPSHIISGAGGIETYFTPDRLKGLFGSIWVLRFKNDDLVKTEYPSDQTHYEVSKSALIAALAKIGCNTVPEKIIVTLDEYPANLRGDHNPNIALTLSEDAAEWLSPVIDLYGTSWKSTDFKPGSRERPIHKILLKTAMIIECLDLLNVPAGNYFISAFPIPILGASESPICPVLFTKEEFQTLGRQFS